MKKIQYIKYGLSVIMDYNEHNEAIANKEADEGCVPEIFDDGKPEPVKEPSATEILNTLLGVNV